ncbi:MAG: hypothetical protein QMD21_07930, partial [Candidatus Thermoplasmatota archaeon]|nr:hypothetical protein [Candidatus Thermoplasmatota archaeon]
MDNRIDKIRTVQLFATLRVARPRYRSGHLAGVYTLGLNAPALRDIAFGNVIYAGAVIGNAP